MNIKKFHHHFNFIILITIPKIYIEKDNHRERINYLLRIMNIRIVLTMNNNKIEKNLSQQIIDLIIIVKITIEITIQDTSKNQITIEFDNKIK